MEISYKQLLPNIHTLIFDVDGVLTNGMVTIMPDGALIRQMNIKDGYALKTALDKGLNVCIISGGNNDLSRYEYDYISSTNGTPTPHRYFR